MEKTFNKNITHTHLRFLEADERKVEVARMLGGEKITETTRAHAEEMLAALHNA